MYISEFVCIPYSDYISDAFLFFYLPVNPFLILIDGQAINALFLTLDRLVVDADVVYP